MSKNDMNNNYIHRKTIYLSASFALLAALLYGFSSPFSKLLLKEIKPSFLAALLYLGAGIGMAIIILYRNIRGVKQAEANLAREDLKYVILMIVLDICAPLLLLKGLESTSAETVSLLNNFEIVATTLIALTVFKEAIGKRMGLSLLLITASTLILTVSDFSQIKFSIGALYVVGACICWGLENNSTRALSLKNPLQIVAVKGLGSGFGALIIAFILKEVSYTSPKFILFSLVLGFLAYGMSIYFYVKSQRVLGASRTSAFYGAAPFIGVIISLLIFKEKITMTFILALTLMLIGSYFAVSENHEHEHVHDILEHEHIHSHDDMHHDHSHEDGENLTEKKHSHKHKHEKVIHTHVHTPDLHHTHEH